jgi:glycosyltransferase involved in cell wall biosynthesis
MTRPLVSIVTPSYNQAQFLEETILSILDQDYPSIEYVVVDDGSTDGSLDIINRYADRLHWWTQQENAGQVAAINRGFEHTGGALMTYINSDDTLLPGAVSEMVAAFEEDPDLVMVYGDSVYTDADSNQTGLLPSREWDPPTMVRKCDNHVVQPSSMWTRNAWDQAGPFDERGYYFFDFELYLRFSVLGPVKHVARPWSTYRLHADSKSDGAQLGKAMDYLRFADDFLTSDRLPATLRLHAREGRASARVAAANNLYGELELGRARRWLWEALALHPGSASRSSLSLAAKSLLPKPVVRRLRQRRNANRRDER